MSIPQGVVATGGHCGGRQVAPGRHTWGPESCPLLADFSILYVPPGLDAGHLPVAGSWASQVPAAVIHQEALAPEEKLGVSSVHPAPRPGWQRTTDWELLLPSDLPLTNVIYTDPSF